MGLSLSELEELTVGFVIDLMTEASNDEYNYQEKASQEDFDKF